MNNTPLRGEPGIPGPSVPIHLFKGEPGVTISREQVAAIMHQVEAARPMPNWLARAYQKLKRLFS